MATTGPGATGVSLKGQQTIALFKGPYKGILRDVPFSELPPDALYHSHNCVYRAGGLIERPGMQQLSPTDLGSRVTGAVGTVLIADGAFQANAFQNDAFQVTGVGQNPVYLASTLSKLWAYYSNAWHEVTGSTALTGAIGYPGRFTTIQSGGVIQVLFTDGLSVPQIWATSTASTFVDITGSPPKFTDWTTSSERIIGILPPYTIQWNAAFVVNAWPANQYIISDTPDFLVAIRNLGTLNVAVYKTNSIWVGIAQGGPDATYFRFELRGTFEGPANPNCVVDVDGTHYYMTNSGRVGMFDGTRFTWINDPILPDMRANINVAQMALAHGCYDAFNREVWFSYPTMADGNSGNVTGLLVLTLPKPYSYEGLTFHSSFHGDWAFSVPCSVGRILSPEHDVIVFAQPSPTQNLSYLLVENSIDATVPFDGFWQTGVQMAPKGDVYRATGVETYATRGSGFGTLEQRILYSTVQGVDGAIQGPPATVFLNESPEPIHAKVAGWETGESARGGARGRFFGVRYDFTAPMRARYTGSRIFGEMTE